MYGLRADDGAEHAGAVVAAGEGHGGLGGAVRGTFLPCLGVVETYIVD